jgi:glutamate transport system substrate-binding protein
MITSHLASVTRRPSSRRARRHRRGTPAVGLSGVLILLATMVAAVLVFAVSGQGQSEPSKDADGYRTEQLSRLPRSPTLDRIQRRGRLVVGIKFDQPLFGLKDWTTGAVTGFDAEIARILATRILGDPGDVEFVETVSGDREQFLGLGVVDVIVATYTITSERARSVDFAGPYYTANQDILVRAGDNSVSGVDDLGGRRVCSVQGSTSAATLRAKAPQARLLLLDTYSLCASALRNGEVDAVTTDNTILLGLIYQNPGAFKMLARPFTVEPYGIGLRKGDETFRGLVDDTLSEATRNGDWKKAFEKTVGGVAKTTPTPPVIDGGQAGTPRRRSPTGPASATATASPTSQTSGVADTAALWGGTEHVGPR